MPYLLKTEPGTYSIDDLARDAETVWDGVTAPAAVKYLAGMKRGEMIVIYHTGSEKRTVGIAKVIQVDASNPKVPLVRLKFVKRTTTQRTLAEIKSQSPWSGRGVSRWFLSLSPSTPGWRRSSTGFIANSSKIEAGNEPHAAFCHGR
jgi:predicted RNA-binding protein with PUA-like domain